MVRQNRITDTDVPSDTLVEASFGKDSVSGCKMLFAIQPLLLGRIEFRVRPNSQRLA